MSFFNTLDEIRSLPEEKRTGIVFALAGACTVLIFGVWVFFVSMKSDTSAIATVLKENTKEEDSASSAPSPAELFVAGVKARNDEFLEQTAGLREMLGLGGSGEAETPVDASLTPGGSTGKSENGAEGGEGAMPSASRPAVLPQEGGMTDAEKEAILDEYFNAIEAQKQQAAEENQYQ